jgi:Sigma-54 interaction domain
LILGESGVGKDVLASYIHRHSDRAHGPFVRVNCAALPDELLESELFGYDQGAFTGAGRSKPGKFELADNGTVSGRDWRDESSPSSEIVARSAGRRVQPSGRQMADQSKRRCLFDQLRQAEGNGAPGPEFISLVPGTSITGLRLQRAILNARLKGIQESDQRLLLGRS